MPDDSYRRMFAAMQGDPQRAAYQSGQRQRALAPPTRPGPQDARAQMGRASAGPAAPWANALAQAGGQFGGARPASAPYQRQLPGKPQGGATFDPAQLQAMIAALQPRLRRDF